jgi:shikimate dehydrogenase
MTLAIQEKYAVIGNPISQSKSPLIHNQFAAQTKQDLTYGKIEGSLNEGGFRSAAEAFRLSGGLGMNITAPFKLDAFDYATQASDRATQAGAANALKFIDDQIVAENFDGVGLIRDIHINLQYCLAGKRVLLLGAGGATRGAIMPILEKQPAMLVIANRTAMKAQHLAKQYDGLGNIAGCGFDGLANQQFDVILNATSASLNTQSVAIPRSVFQSTSLAYELAYGKGLTPFLRLAKSVGVIQVADGVGMLVEQAAEAFFWWRGVRPDTQAIIQELTIALV